MNFKKLTGLLNTKGVIIIAGLVLVTIVITSLASGGKEAPDPEPTQTPVRTLLANPSHVPLLFVRKGDLVSLKGNTLTAVGENLSWPGGKFATTNQLVVVDRQTGKPLSFLEGLKTNFGTEGPQGLSAVVYRSGAQDTLSIEPLGVNHQAYRIMSPDFSPTGWLAFAAKESEEDSWRIWLWNPTFEGNYRREFLKMLTPLESGSDMVFPSFAHEEGDTRLVFSAREPSPEEAELNKWDIWLAHYGTNSHTGYEQLTKNGNAIDPDWGPQKLIAYTSFDTGTAVPEDFVFAPGSAEIHILNIETGNWWPVLSGQMPYWDTEWPQEQRADEIVVTLTPTPEPTLEAKVADCSGMDDLSKCCLDGWQVPQGSQKWNLTTAGFVKAEGLYSGEEELTGEFSTLGFCRTKDDYWWQPKP